MHGTTVKKREKEKEKEKYFVVYLTALCQLRGSDKDVHCRMPTAKMIYKS
jgi:hypothetical protein